LTKKAPATFAAGASYYSTSGMAKAGTTRCYLA
jgi:hypothetical protein